MDAGCPPAIFQGQQRVYPSDIEINRVQHALPFCSAACGRALSKVSSDWSGLGKGGSTAHKAVRDGVRARRT